MITVGFGAAVIPVLRGEEMGGYDDRIGGVSGTLDPLTARVLTVMDGRRRFALVVFDAICVNRDLVQEIRRALDADSCWVSATHTHAGPQTGCRPGGAPTPASIRRRLVAAAADAYGRALATEAPRSARTVRVRVPGLAGTRAATGAREIPLDLLVFTDEQDAIRGALVTVPVHPTVLPAANTRVSADLAGGIRDALSRRLRSGAHTPWVIVTTGAAGDISTRNTRPAQTVEAIAQLAQSASASLASAADDAAPLGESRSACALREATATIALAAIDPHDLALPSEDALPSPDAEPAPVKAGAVSRTEFTRRQGIQIARALRTEADGAPFQAEICAITLGEAVLVAIPGEAFLSQGEAIVAALAPRPTFVIGYANGYLGYLPDRASFDNPSYETYATAVAAGSAERITAEAIRLALSTLPEA